MDYTQKMFLVPQSQLNALRQPPNPHIDIRESAQNELDKAMGEVLNSPSDDIYEKAKKYTNILQRYLSFSKQGDCEKNILTLLLPEKTPTTGVDGEQDGKDRMIKDILLHIPNRNKNNARYILSALSNAPHLVSWNTHGEIVIGGRSVKGSHLYDLIKNVTSQHNMSTRPVGWTEFLKTLADLNIPSTTIPNKNVREMVTRIKSGAYGDDGDDDDDAQDSIDFGASRKSTPVHSMDLGARRKKSTPALAALFTPPAARMPENWELYYDDNETDLLL